MAARPGLRDSRAHATANMAPTDFAMFEDPAGITNSNLRREVSKRVVRGISEAPDRSIRSIVTSGANYSVPETCLVGEALGLSPREAEIARLVAKGLPNKTIGAVLDISPHTVSTHLRRIFAKLDVNNRTALAARLIGGP